MTIDLDLQAIQRRTALSPQGGGQGNKGSVAAEPLPVMTADEPATPSEDSADG